MKKVERVLIAKRTTDGLFLRLDEQAHTTEYDFVKDPCLAKRITPMKLNGYGEPMTVDEGKLFSPNPASHYFENSFRAREYWTRDCVMIPFEIVTEVVATELYQRG